MRRAKKEIKSQADIEAVLRAGRFCSLAMSDGGLPYVVPLVYGYRAGVLYIHSANAGKKMEILRKNPNVCFTVVADAGIVGADKACAWTCRFRSVIGFGRAVFPESLEEKREGLAAIMEHYSSNDFNFSESLLERTIVIRLDIDSMTGKRSS